MYVRPSASPLERVRLPNLIPSASLLLPEVKPHRIPRPGPGASALTTQGGLLSVAVANVQAQQTPPPALRAVDEQADSAVRKAVLYFGPSGHNPRLFIGFRCVFDVFKRFDRGQTSCLFNLGTKSTSMLADAFVSSTLWRTTARASVSQRGTRFTNTPRSFARSKSK
jgi:hypothetical protein